MTETMKRIEVAAAVIRDGDRILATQRGYGEFKDWWEFPGGKMEPGETAVQALVREIREEMDAEIRTGELIKTVEWDYPAFHITLHCYWAEPLSAMKLKEHEAARWLSCDQLDSVRWLPADLSVIDAVRTALQQ